MGRQTVAAGVILFVLVAGACGASTSSGAGRGTAATDPGATDAEMGNPAAAGADAGAAAGAPTIADATYASGSAHVEVSGVRPMTLDAQLAGGGLSMTGAGATLLMYPADGNEGGLFSISNTPETGLNFTLQMPGLVTGADSTNCPIELTKNDASGIAGRFDCSGLDALFEAAAGSVNVKSTFSATK